MADDVTRLGRCTRCGTALSADGPDDLCPACLLALGVADDQTRLDDATRPEDATRSTEVTTLSTEAHTVLSGGSASAAPGGVRAQLTPGQTFGPYRIERLLGRGGMGEVYAAEHLEHGRRLALKVLSARLADRDDRARFLREGQLAASINHPHSVYIFGSEEIGGMPIITMELLPGGTLKDKVVAEGPLGPAAAVDAVLDMIGGLDAAHAGGILHRDIKPANCFVDHDGTVKIGDFGLSISTMAREVTEASGVFQGTPQFAAPEQLRGEPLDVRADIYAVGATLFYLLTGHAPFEDADLTTLITRVKDEPARSPRAISSKIPKGLADIVLRCLAKEKTTRPASYAALHDELRPFGRATLVPAPLGLRLGAGALDCLVVALGATLPTLAITAASPAVSAAIEPWLVPLLYVGYWSITEGVWGEGIGKAQCGLRVVTTAGARPGLARATVRAVLFFAPLLALAVVRTVLPESAGSALPPFAGLVGVSLLFVSARRHNGYAGLHELATGTRVVERSPTRDAAPAAPSFSPNHVSLRRIGPYEIVRSVGETDRGEMLLGWDPRLRRTVWIHALSSGADPLMVASQASDRPGQLRWLGGQRPPKNPWDAYEALDGMPLASWSDPQPWRIVRRWLLDLALALDAGLKDGSLTTVSIARVWVSVEHGAKWLDFLAPGAAVHGTGDAPASSQSVQSLLHEVAQRALGGRVGPPLPLSASTFLSDLQAQHFGDVQDVVSALATLSTRADRLTRIQRDGALAIGTLFTIASAQAIGNWTPIADAFPRHPALAHAAGSVVLAGLALLWALALRGGFWLRAFNIAVVTHDGREVSRSRAVLRAVVVWSWAPLQLLARLNAAPGADNWGLYFALDWAIAVVKLFALIWASRYPERGLQDRLAGTWLVPR